LAFFSGIFPFDFLPSGGAVIFLNTKIVAVFELPKSILKIIFIFDEQLSALHFKSTRKDEVRLKFAWRVKHFYCFVMSLFNSKK
jgi:hypothetical protein